MGTAIANELTAVRTALEQATIRAGAESPYLLTEILEEVTLLQELVAGLPEDRLTRLSTAAATELGLLPFVESALMRFTAESNPEELEDLRRRCLRPLRRYLHEIGPALS